MAYGVVVKALLLFEDAKPDRRVEVVKNFTRRLLVERPGLKVGAAFGKLAVVDGKLRQKDIDDLYHELKVNQNNVSPVANVPYCGLTLNCPVNGAAANFYGTLDDTNFYSQEAAIRFLIADEANQSLRTRFNEIFAAKHFAERMTDYCFPLKGEGARTDRRRELLCDCPRRRQQHGLEVPHVATAWRNGAGCLVSFVARLRARSPTCSFKSSA